MLCLIRILPIYLPCVPVDVSVEVHLAKHAKLCCLIGRLKRDVGRGPVSPDSIPMKACYTRGSGEERFERGAMLQKCNNMPSVGLQTTSRNKSSSGPGVDFGCDRAGAMAV